MMKNSMNDEIMKLKNMLDDEIGKTSNANRG
jgi:hypothetical protein